MYKRFGQQSAIGWNGMASDGVERSWNLSEIDMMSVDMEEVKRLEYRNGCYDSWVSVLVMEIRGYPRKWIHLRRASWWVGCRWRNRDWEIWWMLSAMRWNRMKCDGVYLVMKSECYSMKKKSFFFMQWDEIGWRRRRRSIGECYLKEISHREVQWDSLCCLLFVFK